jgi:TonB-dependent starch-binding outer membrane protein SusC
MSRLGRLITAILAMAILPTASFAQNRGSVSGQVTDASTRQPVVGALVRVNATTLQVVTNEQGRFTLNNVPAGARTLQISRVGYRLATTTVTVGETPASVTVTLSADAIGLDEIVAVGYGEARRRNVAGAVASLRPEQAVRDLPVTSINSAMQGRLAGVQISQNSGTPGGGVTVRIRGSSSIGAGNDPLYVIDGVPMTQGDQSPLNVGATQGTDAINDLNPNEIESIEVLKDASAAAIYGSRASNGVILITTKRGTAQRTELSFGAYSGSQEMWKTLDMLNAQQFVEVYTDGLNNAYGTAEENGFADWVGNDPENSWWYFEPGANTNWIDAVTRAAPISSFDGSVRGGTERVRYYVSGSLLTQGGIVRSQGYQRMNGRVNLDYVPTSRLTLGTNVALSHADNDRARNDNTIYGSFANAIANPPIEPIYNEDGTYYNTSYANPVGLLDEQQFEERSVRILGNTFARFQINDWLNLRGSVGLDNLATQGKQYESAVVGLCRGSNGCAIAADAFVTKVTYEGTANFTRAFGDNHEVTGVVGSSYETNVSEGASASGTQFPSNQFKHVSSATLTSASSYRTQWNLVSFFGRVSHTFSDRIVTTLNVRTDGSSRFGEDHRYGTFPSASVLWRVGDEGFMQNQSLVSNLALRASYGRTGNQQGLGNFGSRGLFGAGFNYGDQPGIAPTQLANPDLRWESTDQLNLGADFSLANERLGFTVDWYNKKTNDLLLGRPIPGTTGFSTISANIGSMENTGVELALRANVIQGGDNGLNWTANFNISRNRNKVTGLYLDQPLNFGFASRAEVGQPLGAFYGYVMDGIIQTGDAVCYTQAGETSAQRNARCAAAGLAFQSSLTDAGDIRFRDLNADGVITADDRTIIGNPWPDFEGGFTNTFGYRGLDMTAFLQFSKGNDVWNGNRTYMDRFGSGGDNHTTRALERWTPENPSTTEPRAIWTDPNVNSRNSSRFIEDGSYIRLKNLVVGYTVPTRTLGGLGMRSARIYLQGQNLWTSTKYSGMDPEVNFSGASAVTRGTDFYTLPQLRTVTIGVNVGY